MWDSTYYAKQTSIVNLEIAPNNNEQNKKKNDVQIYQELLYSLPTQPTKETV